jgi:hypothetical protein
VICNFQLPIHYSRITNCSVIYCSVTQMVVYELLLVGIILYCKTARKFPAVKTHYDVSSQNSGKNVTIMGLLLQSATQHRERCHQNQTANKFISYYHLYSINHFPDYFFLKICLEKRCFISHLEYTHKNENHC